MINGNGSHLARVRLDSREVCYRFAEGAVLDLDGQQQANRHGIYRI